MSAVRRGAETIAPGVVRLIAPNPGPMTGPGTNSYVVGTGPCAIIDPGVNDDDHLDALVAAAPGEIVAVLVTHAHPDHTGGARRLAERLGVAVHAHATQLRGVRDKAFHADRFMADGDRVALGDITLEAIHTPGHAADHLCFLWRETGLLFAGDTVMADVTVVILPPDGGMTAYLESLTRLRALPIKQIAPGHGRMLDDALVVLAQIVEHRLAREAQVREALADSDDATTADAIAARLYPDLDPRLRGMAAAQVESHLLRLAELGQAQAAGDGWAPD
ncbi:MBL fold metallo-hydrolase [Endozoicomonas sp. G2_2]|uniref:MBL fold metallo-hydrolase n=1 Tax=Endozoicomonas sp. G2_2 TaxID=2821092 RepID=UPI001ADD315F|nr:MBL fold metallo-hydrolase [Endozoicomonas sp. G2_2]MBO9469389.1 MBL fold metallo-hydrolase [Endozoicomonas sp. G2_2]